MRTTKNPENRSLKFRAVYIYFLFASGGIDPRLAAAIRSVLYEFRSLAAKAAKASPGEVVHISCK